MTGRKAERKVRTKERTLEMNKKSDTVNSELRDKLFIVLALTGCVSNIAGFTANAVISDLPRRPYSVRLAHL